ncbi:MAG: RelA/SpoT domain-containing protein [Candidatus Paceibacterota bacterium]
MKKTPSSKAQIDRLGDRLKGGAHTESDLRLLDDYRRSFGEAYEAVVRTLRQRGEVPTGRLAKSTVSIVEKLRRESIRLSQMQDIAGCRIVVGNVVEQEQLVASLKSDYTGASLIDRRDQPSHGYRAVHIIAEVSGKPIEIQVRSFLQHLWAEVSEKSSDVLDPTIKYGGGSDAWRNFLTMSSREVASFEEIEKKYRVSEAAGVVANASYERISLDLAALRERIPGTWLRRLVDWRVSLSKQPGPDQEDQEMRAKLEALKRKMESSEQECQKMRRELVRMRNLIADLLTRAISDLDKLKGEKQ